jgi:predicted phosphoribosyltransferase
MDWPGRARRVEFADRHEAGGVLAGCLAQYAKKDDVVVLALAVSKAPAVSRSA